MIAHNMETVEEITERGSALTDRVIREYMEGASIWALKMKYSHLLTHSGVRRLLEGIVRPSSDQTPSDPSPDEIVAARDRLKAQWSAETASRRWVGRYLSRPETLGEALSKNLEQVDRRYR
jgi:hypothetical protein